MLVRLNFSLRQGSDKQTQECLVVDIFLQCFDHEDKVGRSSIYIYIYVHTNIKGFR